MGDAKARIEELDVRALTGRCDAAGWPEATPICVGKSKRHAIAEDLALVCVAASTYVDERISDLAFAPVVARCVCVDSRETHAADTVFLGDGQVGGACGQREGCGGSCENSARSCGGIHMLAVVRAG